MRTRVLANIGAGRLPHGDRLVVAEFAADLFEDLERFLVDQLHRLVGHHLIDGDLAHQRRKRGYGGATYRLAPQAAAASAVGVFGHFNGRCIHGNSIPPTARQLSETKYSCDAGKS